MDEVFLFEEKFTDDKGEHTVLVSETLKNNIPIVYNCIVDIHTNIELVKYKNVWVENEHGVTAFSEGIGKMIESFIQQKS